jgi:hypothetical protein
MLQITSRGSFDKTDRFLSRMSKGDIFRALDVYARRGVSALSAATPEETGVTAASWDYRIEKSGRDFTIWWINTSKDEAGTPIVIMLQFGHGTGTGGYVQGRDFINPAIQPIFDQIASEVWKEVTSS